MGIVYDTELSFSFLLPMLSVETQVGSVPDVDESAMSVIVSTAKAQNQRKVKQIISDNWKSSIKN